MSIITEQVRSLTKDGHTAAQIASMLGVSVRTVTRHREPGVHNGPVPAEKLALIQTMVADGAAVTEIARTVSVTPRTVKRHFPQASWTCGEAGSFARERDRIRRQARANGVLL